MTDPTFIEPSPSAPMQKIGRDGVVHPGKLGQAREGSVSNPGVRSLGSTQTAPRCPACGEATLKMRMNKPAGQRIYCSNKSCGYDQAKQGNTERVNVNPETKIVTNRNSSGEGRGVQILRNSGPR